MEKFQRNYRLEVETNNPTASPVPLPATTLVFTLPLTIQFDVVRNVLSSANNSVIRIWNLSENHRNQIRKNINNVGDVRKIRLFGGYGQNLSMLFSGYILEAFSVREGVDFITEITSFDFSFINSNTAQSFPKETERTEIAKSIAKNLEGTTIGAVGNTFTGTIPRGNSYSGSAVDLLRDLSGGGFYIENGKVYLLSQYEVLDSNIVIDASVGLLNTPMLQDSILRFSMLLEPRLRCSLKISLKSSSEPILNGDYKIVSLTHRGTISDAVCGEAITEVGLLAPFAGTPFNIIPEFL